MLPTAGKDEQTKQREIPIRRGSKSFAECLPPLCPGIHRPSYQFRSSSGHAWIDGASFQSRDNGGTAQHGNFGLSLSSGQDLRQQTDHRIAQGEPSVLNEIILLILARLFNVRCLSSRSRCPRKKHEATCTSSVSFIDALSGKIGDPNRTLTIDFLLSLLSKLSLDLRCIPS